jgi:hypothetical protein
MRLCSLCVKPNKKEVACATSSPQKNSIFINSQNKFLSFKASILRSVFLTINSNELMIYRLKSDYE